MITMREWLKDIVENYYVDLEDGEVVILPIKESD